VVIVFRAAALHVEATTTLFRGGFACQLAPPTTPAHLAAVSAMAGNAMSS